MRFTALGVVLPGVKSGFVAALANPFFTGIAHTIAELPCIQACGIALLPYVVADRCFAVC
ncbi:hypothetical protein OH492_15330 [Vibrio chagasii]|nr:hypothetical protein [Vibrio chagasii]